MRKDGNNRMQNAGKTAGKRAGDNDIPGSIEWYAERGEDEMEKNTENSQNSKRKTKDQEE